MEIGIHGIANAGQNAGARNNLVARKTGGLGELNPLFNAPNSFAIAVMVHDALSPGAPEGWIVALGKYERIFNGNVALVVIAVQRPGLNLSPRQRSRVHPKMEGVAMVVTSFAHSLQALAQLLGREQGVFRNEFVFQLHSHPSFPIRQPESSTSLRSLLRGSSTGLV